MKRYDERYKGVYVKKRGNDLYVRCSKCGTIRNIRTVFQCPVCRFSTTKTLHPERSKKQLKK